MKFSFVNNLKNWQIFLIMTAVIFSLYGQAVFFGFSYLDDNTLILDNFRFISDPSNILETFKQDVFHVPGEDAFYYRPFLTIYFMIGAFIGGQNPAAYHFLNILIHLVAVFLLFIFLQKLEFNRRISFFASLIFAIHPVLAQAVAWIPGINDPLVAVLVLASFIFFIDYLNSKEWKYLVLHLVFWLGALFSKETAVFAPIILCLYVFLKKGIFFTGNKNRNWRFFLPIAIGWLLMFGSWFLLRYQALGGRTLGMSVGQALGCVYRNILSIFLYVGKALLPVNLSVFPFLQDQTFIYGFMATAIIATLLYLNRKHVEWKNVVFGAVWFVVFLVPSLLRPNLQIVPDLLEHRIYLPLIGLIIILLEIDWKKIGELLSHFIETTAKNINIALLFALLLVLFVTTLIYSRNFQNKISFWNNAVNNSPHAPLAHRNLGAMYWIDGRPFDAEPEYLKALELNPYEPMAHNNLGLIYAQRGDYDNAFKEYEAELKNNPNYDNAFYNMGLAYWSAGKKEDAAKSWLKAIEINPDLIGAYSGLVVYYQELGDKKTAQRYFQEYLSRGGVFPMQ